MFFFKTVETPKAVKPPPPTKPAKKEPEVIEIEDEEEIFPSVGRIFYFKHKCLFYIIR